MSTALLATVVAAAPAHATTTITELGGLPGSAVNWVVAINDSGVAVGGSSTDGGYRTSAVKFDAGGASELVGPAGALTHLYAVNNNGVGAGLTTAGGTRPIRFAADGTYQVLGVPFGYTRAYASAIDDSGTAYGIASDHITNAQIPVRWRPNGVFTSMKMPSGATWGHVTTASPNGYVVGFVGGDGIGTTAVRWNPDGSVTTLAGLTENVRNTAQAVNRNGDVVGTADDGEQSFGVRWRADGAITKLAARVEPKSINDLGVTVGWAYHEGKQLPFRWNDDGEKLELGLPEGTDSVYQLDINNEGVIVGSAGIAAYKWTVS
ncbi:hypothetical protein [Lentzea albida]|uniref:hypothetical protein n=1 Tax=Lentzea albida TaxID=65499 RepID=UPI000B7CB90A|nr:hypothetical protein [Lentzea albida]